MPLCLPDTQSSCWSFARWLRTIDDAARRTARFLLTFPGTNRINLDKSGLADGDGAAAQGDAVVEAQLRAGKVPVSALWVAFALNSPVAAWLLLRAGAGRTLRWAMCWERDAAIVKKLVSTGMASVPGLHEMLADADGVGKGYSFARAARGLLLRAIKAVCPSRNDTLVMLSSINDHLAYGLVRMVLRGDDARWRVRWLALQQSKGVNVEVPGDVGQVDVNATVNSSCSLAAAAHMGVLNTLRMWLDPAFVPALPFELESAHAATLAPSADSTGEQDFSLANGVSLARVFGANEAFKAWWTGRVDVNARTATAGAGVLHAAIDRVTRHLPEGDARRGLARANVIKRVDGFAAELIKLLMLAERAGAGDTTERSRVWTKSVATRVAAMTPVQKHASAGKETDTDAGEKQNQATSRPGSPQQDSMASSVPLMAERIWKLDANRDGTESGNSTSLWHAAAYGLEETCHVSVRLRALASTAPRAANGGLLFVGGARGGTCVLLCYQFVTLVKRTMASVG